MFLALPPSFGIISMHHHTQLFTSVLGTELMSIYSQGKQFTGLAISPAQNLIIFQIFQVLSSLQVPPPPFQYFPFHLHILIFFYSPLNSISVAHAHMAVGHPLRHGQTTAARLPEKRLPLSQQLLVPIAPELEVESHEYLSHPCWEADWLDLVQVTIAAETSWMQQHCCVRKTAFHNILSILWLLHSYLSPSSMMFPEPWEGAQCKCPI